MTRWMVFGLFGLFSLMTVKLAQAVPASVVPDLGLQWRVERIDTDARGGRSALGRFTLHNRGSTALPAKGWSLYFNCLAEAVTGPVDGPFVVEQLVGTLYRVRPTAAFAGLAPGARVGVGVRHHDTLQLPDRQPLGPYLVLDTEPNRALPFKDYRREPSALPDPDPETRYARNAALGSVGEMPPVFPPPQRWALGAGELVWRGLPAIDAPPALRQEAAQARAWLQALVSGTAAPGAQPLRMRLRAGLPTEGYQLQIDARHGVLIEASSAAGIHNGLQALRDLLPLKPGTELRLPALQIDDAPRFAYRGLLIDVARSFLPKADLLRVIELMARLRLNKLHLHLSDDEGWRLAIRGLPELTEVSGQRGHTLDPQRALTPAHGSGGLAGQAPGSGFYSGEDYIEILRHAARHHVELIPEIEMPGHARAAVVAMRAREQRLAGDPRAADFRLTDPDDRSRYSSAQRYTDNVMDPGLPSTYRFIGHVVDELVRLHREAGVPLRTLHVGADETPAGAWAGSPAAQAAMQRHGLKHLGALWNHFYDRVHALVRRRGVQVAGWEELGARRSEPDGSGPLVPNEHFQGRDFTLHVWNNLGDSADLAYRLANAGYRIVLAPATAYYFDMAHELGGQESGVNWAAIVDLQTVFDHLPLDALRPGPLQPLAPGATALTAQGRRHIAGLEGTAFSEIIHTRAQLEALLLPRLLALAERAWSADPSWASEADATQRARLYREDWTRFVRQAGAQVLPRLARDFPGLNFRLAPPGLTREGDSVRANHQLPDLPGLTIRYTTDLSEPRADSPVMPQSPASLNARATVRAAAFDATGRRGPVATLASPDRVVFLGDSITEGWAQADPAYFADPARLNRGISGQTTGQMLARLQADVLNQQPRVLVLLAGTNDIAGNGGPTTEAEIAARIETMAEAAQAAGIRVVLVSVLPAARYNWAPAVQPAARIVDLNRRLAAYANARGHRWVDLHALMADAHQGLPPRFGGDGVHPNAEGYRVMRDPVEAAIQAELQTDRSAR